MTERLLAPMRRLGQEALVLVAEAAREPGAREAYARALTAVAWSLRGEDTAAGLVRRYYFDQEALRAAAAAALEDPSLSAAVAVGAGVWTRLVDLGLEDGELAPAHPRTPGRRGP